MLQLCRNVIATQVSHLKTHDQRRSGLSRDAFEALKQSLLGSPLVGRSTLGGPFRSSRGFAVIFHGEGVDGVVTRFPTLGPYLARTLGAPGVERLRPWYRSKPVAPNAWYLNVLLVGTGGTVSRHVDATLRPFLEQEVLPTLVSVLYLEVPGGQGGELQLWHEAEPVARIQPRSNHCVHFRGDLAHAVEPFSSGASDAVRASLVIEQYTLSPEQLAAVPTFKLDSRAGFEAYLAAQQQRAEVRQFELEP